MFRLSFRVFFLSLFCFSLLSNAVSVRSAAELIDLFKTASGKTLNVPIDILADIDFSQSGLILPLGANSKGTCVAFSGVLHGKGHAIKGLVMDNRQSNEYDRAGLFCSLKGASVDNLIFDSSCSFNGQYAGALSPFVVGSASVINVTNKAAVSGYEGVGGFIGRIQDADKGSTFSFDGCTNLGTVKGDGYAGGFIGRISETTNVRIVISNSVNSGNIVAKLYGSGGFISYLYTNTNIAVTLSKCINNGRIEGDHEIGGLVGYFGSDLAMTSTMTLEDCTNNGPITGNGLVGGFVGKVFDGINLDISRGTNNGAVSGGKYGYIGGFIGYIDVLTTVKISSSTNNADITCEGSNVAGFVGYSSAYSYFNISLVLLNCENKGSVSAMKSMACGLGCVSDVWYDSMENVVVNSINKGSVSAPEGSFGITNMITRAISVVSMGKMSGSSSIYSFWKKSSNVDSFYGLKETCVNCESATTLFKFNSLRHTYEVIWNGKRVHDLLNIVSQREHYGMLWTSDLDLFEAKAPSF